ncbi:MAG: type I-E CRISPR-associated protein Cas6/Cse3/CasE [Butyricicoccus sp.]|nr:type I-E CRISPR-associated protein Cas6/Cse3/CasE [Butyricicoccus sp.]
MYLSRVELDTSRRSMIRALDMPNLIHGAVESAFSGERERNLWRIDPLQGKLYLLLVSPAKPDLQRLVQQFGVPGQSWETRDYSPLLGCIQAGSVWGFRLTANPTKSCASKAGTERGVVHAHISTRYQEEWLLRQAEKHGFRLAEDGFSVVQTKWYAFRKGNIGNRVTFLSVTYEGTLQVTDPEVFRHALIQGIGRGKAYGMGMLTVIRAAQMSL